MPLLLALALAASSAALPVPAHRGQCTVIPWSEGVAPTVNVRINGQGPFTFVVDTGAEDDAWLKPVIAARLGLKVIGKVPPDGPDDPEQDLDRYGGETLQLGDVTFLKPSFNAMLKMGPKEHPFDGIIGSNLWARMQMTFDYRNRQLRLSDAPLRGGQIVRFDRAMPIVPLTIGSTRLETHLDTGNIAGALFVDEAVGRALPLSGPAVVKGKARTHYGELSIMEAPLAAPVRMGGTTLAVTTVRWPPAIGLPNLGSRALAEMTVGIDPRSRRLAIEPAGAPLTCP